MKKILFLTFLIPLFASCTDLLDSYPYGQIDDEKMKEYQAIQRGLVGYAYEQFTRDYNNFEGNRLDCVTDDAVITSTTGNEAKFATGIAVDPNAAIWTNSYKAIANLNLFLKNNNGYESRYYLDPVADEKFRNLLQGEAYGMRAMLEWRLLKIWGGKGIKSGEMLGYVKIRERMTADSEDINLSRSSYDDCVKAIEEDCLEALEYLPVAHRDWLLSEDERVNYFHILGSCNWGKIDGMTIYAILSDMYLTYASDCYNPDGDQSRWEKAYKYAKKALDLKEQVDAVDNGFVATNGLDWFNAYSPNAIFISRRASNTDAHDAHERAFYPAGFRGNGTLGASDDLMRAFPAANGYPIGHPKSNYSEADPYSNRDARMYSMIFYPGSKNDHDYTFETWKGATIDETGKDAPGQDKVSRTGYHIRKMVYPALDWNDSPIIKASHAKFYYRWENMVLNFAEALFEATGSATSQYEGLSPKAALAKIRQRKTYDKVPSSIAADDPYLEEAAASETLFRELVRNERRIEFCFEGTRYYDLRRWNKDLSKINKPVHGVEVTKVSDTEFTYKQVEVEKRNWLSLYFPIPYGDILKASELEQNEGWANWSN